MCRPFGAVAIGKVAIFQGLTPLAIGCRPFGAIAFGEIDLFQGLTPLAIDCRPFGAIAFGECTFYARRATALALLRGRGDPLLA